MAPERDVRMPEGSLLGLTFLLYPFLWRDQAVFTFHKKWLDVLE